MPTRLVIFLFVLAAFLFPWQPAGTYPIDGYDQTEISRLKRLQDMDSAAILRLLPYGSRHALEYVRLNLMEHPVLDLPDTDRALQDELEKVLPIFHPSYSLAVYDMTPGKERYAERNPNRGYQPGSVGKLAVATALFCELENLYLDDLEARSEILKTESSGRGPSACTMNTPFRGTKWQTADIPGVSSTKKTNFPFTNGWTTCFP
jgi:hypothetical protein